jgi:hypothetical protein
MSLISAYDVRFVISVSIRADTRIHVLHDSEAAQRIRSRQSAAVAPGVKRIMPGMLLLKAKR